MDSPEKKCCGESVMPRDLLATEQPRDLLGPRYRPNLGLMSGLGEAGLQVGTGALAGPIAGFAGIGAALMPGGRTGAEAVSDVSNRLTYRPITEAGTRISEAVAAPFEKLDQYADSIAFTLGRGNPLASATIKTAILGLPAVLGLKGGLRIPKAVRNMESRATDLGIDLTSPQIRSQIGEAAQRIAPGVRSETMPGVQSALREASDTAKTAVDAAYDRARATPARINARTFSEFNEQARQALASFDVETMPIVQRRLNELSVVDSFPPGTAVKLEAIEQFRQRLNRNRPATTDTSQNAALNLIKRELDEFIDRQFNQDMIQGNPAAVQAWIDARGARAQYSRNFSDNKTIRQFIEEEATPETMRQWLFGASSVGARREAGLVVKKLKEILGEDSPQLASIRQEMLLDIVEPLLRETPNLKQFITNYDRVVRTNSTLVNELAPFSRTGLEDLRMFAGAVEKTGVGPQIMINLNTLTARALFGHAIARAGMKVSLAKQALDFIRGSGRSEHRKLMAELLGYDPSSPLISNTSLAASSIILAEADEIEPVE